MNIYIIYQNIYIYLKSQEVELEWLNMKNNTEGLIWINKCLIDVEILKSFSCLSPEHELNSRFFSQLLDKI